MVREKIYISLFGLAGYIIQIKSQEKNTDFLVLAGQPLNQKVTARGSMVVETPQELEQAFDDYERGGMGVPWSESLTDDDIRKGYRVSLVYEKDI